MILVWVAYNYELCLTFVNFFEGLRILEMGKSKRDRVMDMNNQRFLCGKMFVYSSSSFSTNLFVLISNFLLNCEFFRRKENEHLKFEHAPFFSFSPATEYALDREIIVLPFSSNVHFSKSPKKRFVHTSSVYFKQKLWAMT